MEARSCMLAVFILQLQLSLIYCTYDLGNIADICSTQSVIPGEQAWNVWHLQNNHSQYLSSLGHNVYVQSIQHKHNLLSCAAVLSKAGNSANTYISSLPQPGQITYRNLVSEIYKQLKTDKWTPIMPSVTRFQTYSFEGSSGYLDGLVLLADLLCDTVTDNSCMTGALTYGDPSGSVTENTGESILETFNMSASFLFKAVSLDVPINTSNVSTLIPQLSPLTGNNYNTTFKEKLGIGNTYYVNAQYGIDWAQNLSISTADYTYLNTTVGNIKVTQENFVIQSEKSCHQRELIINQNYINDILGSPSVVIDRVGDSVCLLTNGTSSIALGPVCPVQFSNISACANILDDVYSYDNCGSAKIIILRGALFNDTNYLPLDSTNCEIDITQCTQTGANATSVYMFPNGTLTDDITSFEDDTVIPRICSELNIPVVNQGVIYIASSGNFSNYVLHDTTVGNEQEPWKTIKKLGKKPYVGDGILCDIDEAMVKLFSNCLDECYTSIADVLHGTGTCTVNSTIHGVTLDSTACNNLFFNYAGFTQQLGAGIISPIDGAVAGIESGANNIFNKDVIPITTSNSIFGIIANNTPQDFVTPADPALESPAFRMKSPAISYQLTNETCTVSLQNFEGMAFSDSGDNINVPTVQAIITITNKLYASNFFSNDAALKSSLYAESQLIHPDTSLATILLAVSTAVGTMFGYNVDNMKSAVKRVIGLSKLISNSSIALLTVSLIVHVSVTSASLAPSIAIIYSQLKAKRYTYSIINPGTINNQIPLATVSMQTHFVQIITYHHQPANYVVSLVLTSLTIALLLIWAFVQAMKLYKNKNTISNANQFQAIP